MPTSTLWRRSAGIHSTRGISPVRPSGDAIERISPEPFFPHTISETVYTTTSTYHDQDRLQGLGLSHTGLKTSDKSFRHPEELLIGHNGRASLHFRGMEAQGHPEHDRSPSQDWSPHQSRPNGNYRPTKGKGHTRSGSTIDDLASAAIATTSPQMNGGLHSYQYSGSPTLNSPTRPSTSHLTYPNHYEGGYEPPAKRIKSERIPTVEWNGTSARPSTSHQQNVTPIEEVELLLGLRNEVNFKSQASPTQPTAHLYHSPTRYKTNLSPQLASPTVESQGDPDGPKIHPGREAFSNHAPLVDSNLKLNVPESQQPIPSVEPSNKVQSHDIEPSHPLNLTMTDLSPIPEAALEVKKTRRIRPQVQAEVCAECNKFQREVDDDDLGVSWICCNGCDRWFHANCVGFRGKLQARSVDKFVCKNCEPDHGPTTFLRTSSRARTAIDYAGLNQGFVKSSVETSMHHYITPIKTGKFAVQPDDFARVRPELLTVEFLESFDNMKRPFVVPACWNPRFGAERSDEQNIPVDENLPREQRFDSTGRKLGPEPAVPKEVATETVLDCDQDLLDMVMPRNLTVRKVAELYGSQELVPVIDVKSQETKGQWTLEQWADYYELEDEKPIRNVISLEVSESPLGRLIRRPKVVRDLDLEDQVWDAESRATQRKRPVQYYCLMSVADSYTDFHIDFGGSSVYYHILKGTKTFFFIAPEDRYLKKYEEWCNSQTQNDTWLPDLCNGAVTRVNLHEGDTAFIPAGWIHSVWTPEDSLVIGGNFLTRIDYDQQLKVANVEKVTKVAPKFRYPFFQKVMWYTLIKYLEEDPVPDEVIQDFEDDPEYTFLRANPVWHEIGELANKAEPGSPDFNSRCYSKPEIQGLPSLRDYLYRTARVYADLPVTDINKRQIEAVKNSIPKGHGDPLVLIKTFAIWSAWKSGGVTVPEWVHSDDEGFGGIENKVKKSEPVRLPGERMSLRRAASSLPQEVTSPAVVTPNKTGPTAEGSSPDPVKVSKSAGRSPSGIRSACDACRRRRVRCPHKDAALSSGNPESLSTAQNQPSTIAQTTIEHTAEKVMTLAPMPDANPKIDSTDGDAHESFNLAQEALTSLDAHLFDQNGLAVNSIHTSSGKKSRSKACEECRKSKRRCVHDEYGRVDPAKAAEPSKPRGSSNGKRPARPSDENILAKKARTDGDVDDAALNLDAMIDPALFELATVPSDDAMQLDAFTGADQSRFEDPVYHTATENPEDRVKSTIEVSEPAEDPKGIIEETVVVKQEQEAPGALDVEERGQGATKAARIDEVEVEPNSFVNTRTPRTTTSPVQRHSSRQTKQVERYMPDSHRSPTKPPPKAAASERRGSSAGSNQTMVTGIKSRRSSSNTSVTTHQIAAGVKHGSAQLDSAKPISRGSTVESELDVDEQLARELQAAEHGLRRRQSMRL